MQLAEQTGPRQQSCSLLSCDAQFLCPSEGKGSSCSTAAHNPYFYTIQWEAKFPMLP